MLYLRTANEVQQAANAIFDRVKNDLAAGAGPRPVGAKYG